MDAITVKHLTKTYGHGEAAVRALRDINVSFQEGMFSVIIGTSGSGKSTLLNLMGGLASADSGEIICGGRNILKLNDAKLSQFRREQTGFVYQSFNLIPELTAKENILMPVRISKKKADMDHFNHLTKTLGIADRLSHYPAQLSGGQQQRTAIACALINHPKIMLCDEPTGNLDEDTANEIIAIFQKLAHEQEKCVVVVTHSKELAEQADVILRLKKGKSQTTQALRNIRYDCEEH